MGKYFSLEPAPHFSGKYLIVMNQEEMPFPHGTRGSYTVMPARVMGLSYPDYLRYVRDKLGAELIGKKSKYISVYFEYTDEVKMLVKLLNKRMAYIMAEQRDPAEYVKEEDGTITRTPFREDESND